MVKTSKNQPPHHPATLVHHLTTNISHLSDHIPQDINTPHEGIHPQPLVVVMKQDGSVVDGRKPVRGYPLSTEVAGICTSWEYLRD